MYVRAVDERNISSELLEAYDTMLSALAAHSQAGKQAMQQAGAIALTRLYTALLLACQIFTAGSVVSSIVAKFLADRTG